MSNRFILWLLFQLFLPSILAAHKQASSKCAQICQQSIEPQCIQKCQNQSQQQVIKTVIATALGFILLCVLFCGCCFLQSHHKFRKLRLLFNTQYKLLKQHNQINNTVMSMKQFNQHVQHIMRLFNQGEKSQNFVRISNGAESVEKAVASVKGVQPFLCELQLEGQDNDGDWSASGAIVCTSQGVICWFYKEYDDDFTKRIKHRMGKFAYVSQPSTMNQLTGDWWRFGNSSKAEQKGQWMLKVPQNSGVQEGYEHSDIQIMN